MHITKGALGLIKSEAELAGVLGHEIAHITKKHTVNAIKKNKAIEVTHRGGRRQDAARCFTALANAAYDNIVENGLRSRRRGRRRQEGLRLANKAGYNPAGARRRSCRS